MRLNKSLLCALAFAATLCGQAPIGVDGFVGTAASPSPVSGAVAGSVDYFNLSPNSTWSGFSGDTWRFTSWAANSLLPSFPDPSGLPIFGTPNDGSIVGGCSFAGSAGMVQISKLPDAFTAATTSNTLLTAYANCALPNDNGWGAFLTAGTSNLGTWKGGDAIFIDNRLLVNIYRQDSPGSVWGDSTLFMSPDAGQHWIDYQHYFTFAVTAATCSAGTVTLTATNTSSVGDIVYVHDLGTGWDGRWTLTVATGSTAKYATTCPGSAAVIGAESAYGTMNTIIDAPDGPNNTVPYNAGSMMWVGAPNQMTWFMFLHYGQDGNWDIPPDAGCDPRTYLCGYAVKRNTSAGNAGFEPMILWRVPRGHEFTKSQYQFYTCAAYNSTWPDPTTVCDGNAAGSWTSTLGSATMLRNNADAGASYPGDCVSVKYFSPHKSYAMVCSTYLGAARGLGRYAFLSLPHPWGPFYPVFSFSDTYTIPGNSWEGIMGYGETIVSTTPPKTQTHISGVVFPGGSASGTANTSGTAITCLTGCAFDSTWVGRNFKANGIGSTVATVTDASHLTTAGSVGTSSGTAWLYADHPAGDSPAFTTIQFSSGRAYQNGIARRAFYQNLGQLGMGHRFSSSSGRGAIPIRGKAADGTTWTLDWWTDVFDHGGQVVGNWTSRSGFRDLMTSGTRYFQAVNGAGGSPTVGYTAGATLLASGIHIQNGNAAGNSRLQGSWTDGTMNGNKSYTMLAVWNHDSSGWTDTWGESAAPLIFEGGTTANSAAIMNMSSYHISDSSFYASGIDNPNGHGRMNDLCWSTGGFQAYGVPTNQYAYCTVSGKSSDVGSTYTVKGQTWSFGAIQVKASASGNPIVTIVLCYGGTCTEYGGGTCDLHASVTGANCNGLWKWCHGTGCTATPSVTATKIELGYDPGAQTNGVLLTGVGGEFGVYSGVVPTSEIIKIYRTLRDDWLRMGRGSL